MSQHSSELPATPVWRVLDAAANRAAEGLRVVEDYARFALDDRHLTEQLKHVRHAFAAALQHLPSGWRLAARDTAADVGTTLKTPSEQSRADLAAVVRAAWNRTQQALRTLEEFGKLVSADFAAQCESLRYTAYSLERALDATATGVERLERTRLYLLVDGGASPAAFDTLVRQVVSAGVHAVQLRDKQLDDRKLVARARQLREATAGTETLCAINDRPDIAALCRADAVHVGQEELSVKDVRAIVGPQMLIGVSTHSIEQARQAVLDGASYIGIGPTFPSSTKSFDAFPGLDLARAVSAEIRLPAFSIGGITRENIAEVRAAGNHRVAVGAAITAAPDPAAAVKEFLEVL